MWQNINTTRLIAHRTPSSNATWNGKGTVSGETTKNKTVCVFASNKFGWNSLKNITHMQSYYTTFTKNWFQLSIESNPELLWFCFTAFCDWFKNFAPPTCTRYSTNQMKSIDRDFVRRVFPRLVPVKCMYIAFYLFYMSRNIFVAASVTRSRIITQPKCYTEPLVARNIARLSRYLRRTATYHNFQWTFKRLRGRHKAVRVISTVNK